MMCDQTNVPGDRFTRRRMLALTGGAAAATTLRPARISARQTPEATPATTASVAADFPVPSTLAADASPEFKAVADAVVEAMRRYKVPGTALGILFGDREEHASFGVASLNSLAPVTGETLFQIGSLTKTFTATAIWRLIDEGALALDAPVRTYIPDLKLMDETVEADATIGNLLDHSAGWYGDEGFDTGENDDAVARYVSERLPILPQIFPIGEFFSYNNAAFTLLGRLIEVATGTTYNAALANLLLAPLGLENSLLDHEAVRQRPFSEGHVALQVNGHDTLTVATPLWVPRSVDPAGGIWSNSRDVIRYARFHLDADEMTAGSANIVSPESLLQMREPVLDVPGLAISMGRNWFVQEIDGIRVFQHNGDTNGFHTEFLAVPELNFAFVLLTNGAGGGLTAMEALDAALAVYPGLGALSGKAGLTHASLAPQDAPTVDLSPETLADYAGQYGDNASNYTVADRDGGLEMSIETIIEPGTWQPAILPVPSPPLALTFLGKDEAVAGGIVRFPFIRNADGDVGWLSSGLRLIPRTGES
jgi:CubicO group peptidase (beta-lactamase class C family)